MFAKKNPVGLVLLLVMYNAQAMELARLEPIFFGHEVYLRVAQYLKATENKIDEKERQRRNDEFLENAKNYHAPKVKACMQVIEYLREIPEKMSFSSMRVDSRKEDVFVSIASNNVFVWLVFSPDVFSVMQHNFLPESYEDHGGFFKSEYHEGVHKLKIDFQGMLHFQQHGKQLKTVDKTVLRKDMILAINDMPIIKAFSAFRYVTQEGIITLKARFDTRVDDECVKGTTYLQEKNYYFTFADLENMPQGCEEILRSMVQKSNEGVGIRNIDKRFKFTDNNIALLKPIKNILENNELFKNAQITTDIAASTAFEKIMDKILFGIPLLVIMAAPDLVHSQTTGILQGMVGVAATGVGCFIIGQYAVPAIDSNNSGLKKLHQWFNVDDCNPIKKGWTFVGLGTMHYLGTAIAQKFLGWNSTPWRVVGGAIHAFRALASLFIISNMEDYGNPFKRSNNKGVPLTFGNLLNGPKFNTTK